MWVRCFEGKEPEKGKALRLVPAESKVVQRGMQVRQHKGSHWAEPQCLPYTQKHKIKERRPVSVPAKPAL